MKILLPIINFILALILVFILVYPEIQAKKVVEAQVLYTKNMGALPFLVAQEKGYFDSLRIKISAEEVVKGGEEVEMVGRGSKNAAFGTLWDLFAFKAAIRPEAYKIFYQVKSSVDNPQTALITLKKKRIRTLKDLKTKRKIGYYKDSKIKQIIKYILGEMGIDPEIHSYIPLSLKEMQTALEENIVDVLVAVEPVRSELLKKNGIKIVDDGFIEKHVFSPYLYSTGFTSIVNVNLNRKAIKRLVLATEMAIDFIRKHPDKTVEIIRKSFGIEDTTVYVNIPSFEKYSEIDPAEIRRLQDKLRDMQVLLREADYTGSLMKREDLR